MRAFGTLTVSLGLIGLGNVGLGEWDKVVNEGHNLVSFVFQWRRGQRLNKKASIVDSKVLPMFAVRRFHDVRTLWSHVGGGFCPAE